MTERETLANDIYDILLTHNALNDDIKQRIIIVLDKYEIQSRTTELAVADPADNINVIKRFMIAKKVAGRSDKTIDQYVRAVNRFIAITGKQLVDVVPDDFRAYLAHRMIDDGIQGQTLVNERSYISAFYDWAVSSELINRNPIKLTEPIKIPKIPKKAFTEMECERIRSACKTPKERALIEILLSTACRVSELISIKTCEIDGNRILVCGKGNKYGQVYLNPKAVYAIETYISSRTDNNPYLFPGKKGDQQQPCNREDPAPDRRMRRSRERTSAPVPQDSGDYGTAARYEYRNGIENAEAREAADYHDLSGPGRPGAAVPASEICGVIRWTTLEDAYREAQH